MYINLTHKIKKMEGPNLVSSSVFKKGSALITTPPRSLYIITWYAVDLYLQEDLYYPHPLVQDTLWGFLHYFAEPVLQRWPFSKLREKAMGLAMKHIHYEDNNTRYLCIGNVEKVYTFALANTIYCILMFCPLN